KAGSADADLRELLQGSGARMQLKLFNTELRVPRLTDSSEAIVSVCPVSAEPLQFGLECLAANARLRQPLRCRRQLRAANQNRLRRRASPRPASGWWTGAAYFYDLAEALEQAKEEIFIADWFLSPEVLLRRPCAGYHELINILYRRATYNVQIYILIYSELTNVLNNHSQYTRKCLYEKLRKTKNIHIILHPRRSLNPQKGLKVAFFGGLDLCWGRWDIPEHPILDNGVNITEFDVNIPTLNPSFEVVGSAFSPYRTPDIHTDLLHYLLSFFPDDEILEHVRLSAEMEQRLNHVSVVPIWRLSRLLGFLRRQLGGDFGDATAASTTETHEQPHAAATAACAAAAAVAANALRKKALDLSRADLDGSRRLKKSSNFVAGQPKLNSLQVGPAEADERASVPVSLRAVTDAATKQLTRLLMPGAPSFLDTSSEDARLANSERPRPDATTAASRDTVDTQSSAPSGGDGAAAGYEVDGRRIVAPKRVLDRLLAAEKNKDEMPSKISSSRESCPRPLMPCQADSQSPGSADGGFNSKQAERAAASQPGRSIWKLQKNAESNRAPHDTESFSKAAKRRLQKHVDTLGSQQSQRTNRGPGTVSSTPATR
uniref:Phospholipase D n=1 Tax=Macrostomum lignano TaxID=282301 RepID=A0A1I8F2K4_9PLAT